jgi:hypothetical protein
MERLAAKRKKILIRHFFDHGQAAFGRFLVLQIEVAAGLLHGSAARSGPMV